MKTVARCSSVRVGVPWAVVVAAAVAALMLLGVVSVERAAAQQADDPIAVWSQLVDALNHGDAAGAVALFSNDAVFQQAGGACDMPCSGKDAVGAQLRQLASAGSAFTTLPGAQANNGVVTGRLQVAANTGTVLVPFTVAVFNGQIAALRLERPAVAGLMSAGSGGLIRVASPADRLPIVLASIAGLLGALALHLFRWSGRRPAVMPCPAAAGLPRDDGAGSRRSLDRNSAQRSSSSVTSINIARRDAWPRWKGELSGGMWPFRCAVLVPLRLPTVETRAPPAMPWCTRPLAPG